MPPGPHQEMHFTGDVCVLHADRIVCMCVSADKTAPFPPSLSLLRRENKPSESVYIPEMPGRTGRMRVRAQRWRQFHQHGVWGWTFPFASASFSGAEPGPPVPGRSWTRLPRGGRAASPGTDRRSARRAHPADPRREARLERGFAPRPRPRPGCGRGGGSGPWLGAGQDSQPAAPAAGPREGGARRGFHPRMRIGTLLLPPRLLKSKSYNL